MAHLSDFRPRIKKTAETWVKLFILANGRAPTEAEIPFGDFEDMAESPDERRAVEAKVLKALERGG